MEKEDEVIRIDAKGRRSFAFADGEPFEVDICEALSLWWATDEQFRDAEGKLLAGKSLELEQALWKFVRDLTGRQDCSLAEARLFLRLLIREEKKLMDFFTESTPAEPPLPATSTTLLFSA